MLRIGVIVNPAAGRGAGRRRSPAIRRGLEKAGATVSMAETRGPGDARRLVDAFRADDVDAIAVAGGDGTLNEACQAYVDVEGRPRLGPPLAVLPVGTGGDFRRTLGLDRDLDRAIDRLMSSPPRAFDLGVLEVTAPDGAPLTRAFVNIASFGLGGLTDRLVNGGPRWLGGRATFFLGTVRGLARFRNPAVRVSVDGAPWLDSPIVNVMIANGRYFGGGMHIAPHADPADGRFDIVAIGDLSRLATLGLAPYVYRGAHLDRPAITTTRAACVEAAAIDPRDEVLVDLDGETPGRLPIRARILPAAIRIRV
jgi:diacylglycerol kinase (ATP)